MNMPLNPVHNLSKKLKNVITRLALFHSMLSSESKSCVNLCKGNTYMSCNHERSYEVVVAATRNMGIGKDGKLPWNLPSDLRFFKELTTSTAVDCKRNAVIMGRRTWESIPQKYRPLPGRLNVVLTQSGKLEISDNIEDLVICNNFSSALKLLAETPRSESIEKVFIIGGGGILKEALNGPGCEAIHLTDIEANIECDTFIPRIDTSLFHLLFSSSPMVENDIQFSFKTYVRGRHCAENIFTVHNNDLISTEKLLVSSSLSKRGAEFDYDYIRQIQENIAGRRCS